MSIVVIDAHECILLLEGKLGGGAAMIGRPAAEVIPAVIWQVLSPRYSEALAGTPQSFPHHSTGGSASYRVHLTPIHFGGTGITAVLALFQDVTESRDAAAALDASEERMRHAETLAGLGSWEMDEESGAADVSEGLNALLGFPANPIVDVAAFLEYVVPKGPASS